MTYAVLWALVVSVCYVDERECESTDVYFYDSKDNRSRLFNQKKDQLI